MLGGVQGAVACQKALVLDLPAGFVHKLCLEVVSLLFCEPQLVHPHNKVIRRNILQESFQT